ncbi:UNVERIFIED_CONTAM: serine/threonine protein phosphatase PrpC [Acetivibrio alkalicellulosi]
MLELFNNSYYVVLAAFIIICVLYGIRYFLINTPEKKPDILIGNGQIIGKRMEQEDSFATITTAKGVMAVLADGMGGYANGKLASSMAVDMFIQQFANAESLYPVDEFFANTARLSNRAILDKAKGVRMGTTLVSVIIADRKLYSISIGDSAIILFRNNEFININKKHVYEAVLEERFVSGQISMRQVSNNPMKKRITSYIGAEVLKDMEISQKPIELKKGDKIILCSDGVTNSLSELELESVLIEKNEAFEAVEKIMSIIKRKNLAKQDNATIIVLEMS